MTAGARAVIGLDIGTSAVKGLLSDGRRRVAAARRPYAMTLGPGGRATVDALDVLAAARTVVGTLAGAARGADLAVVAICAGGSGDEAVFVDAAGRPLAPVPMALDTTPTGAHGDPSPMDRAVDAEGTSDRTGLPAGGTYPVPRFAAFAAESPRLARRVRRILAWPEFLALRLGVPPAAEPSLASRSGGFDVEAGRWDPDLLAAAGIDSSWLPPLVPTGSVLGTVPSRVARELGLGPSVALVAGGFDQAMATAGAGIDRPGTGHLGAGSWEALSVLAPAEFATAACRAPLVRARFSVGPAVAARPDRTDGPAPALVLASVPGAAALEWFGRVVGARRGRRVAEALRLAAAAPDVPSGLTVLTGFAGPVAPGRESAAGAVVAGLDLAAGPEAVALALVEGIALTVAEQIEALGKAAIAVHELRISGGTARDRRWLQLRADATGRVVRAVAPADAGTVAAVALACVAVGLAPSVGDVVGALSRTGPPIAPRPERHAIFRGRLERRAVLRSSLARMAAGRPFARDVAAFA